MEHRREVRYQLRDRLMDTVFQDAVNTFTIEDIDISGLLLDISMSGAGIEIREKYGYAADKLRAYRTFIMQMKLGNETIVVESELVWGNIKDESYIGGIRFVFLEPSDRLKLMDVIASYHEKS